MFGDDDAPLADDRGGRRSVGADVGAARRAHPHRDQSARGSARFLRSAVDAFERVVVAGDELVPAERDHLLVGIFRTVGHHDVSGPRAMSASAESRPPDPRIANARQCADLSQQNGLWLFPCGLRPLDRA